MVRKLVLTLLFFSEILDAAYLSVIPLIYDFPAAATTTTTTSTTPTTTTMTPTTTPVAPVRPSIRPAQLTPGALGAWDDFCRRFDPASYCKYWQRPSRCQFSDYLCGLDGDQVALGCVPDSGTDALVSVGSGFSTVCDVYCDKFVASGSMCEWWRSQPTCAGTQAPCDRGTCEERVQMSERCDRFCQTFAGSMSYCKLADNTCHGSDISCAPSECVKPNGACDSYCKGLNGQGSFCLFWRDRKQCSVGGQNCDASQCF